MINSDAVSEAADQEYTLDLSGVKGPTAFHAKVKEILPVPEWYGSNLDALYDVLTDPSFPGGTITVKGYSELAENSPRYLDALRRLCRDVELERDDLTISFAYEGRIRPRW